MWEESLFESFKTKKWEMHGHILNLDPMNYYAICRTFIHGTMILNVSSSFKYPWDKLN